MVSIPISRAWRGLLSVTGSPLETIEPSSGWCTPEIALIRVDLPAPLSPARASTSPRRSSKPTLSRAVTPPKRLVRSATARIGASVGIAHLAGQPLAGLVDQHRHDDDDAHRHELPERLDVDEDEPVLDDGDDQGTDHGADDGARAAE